MLDELADRYGPVPEEVRNLVRFALLKSLAQRVGVESIDRRQGFANIKFHQQSKVDPLKLMELVRSTEGAQFTPAGVLKLPLGANLPLPATLLGELTDGAADAEVETSAEAVEKTDHPRRTALSVDNGHCLAIMKIQPMKWKLLLRFCARWPRVRGGRAGRGPDRRAR